MGSEITIILGNVGRDPETRFTKEGKQLTSFSVAVNRGREDETNWYNVTCWDRLAETTAQYVRKGMWLQVTGTVRARGYLGKDGEARASLDLTARDVQFGPRADGEGDDSDIFDPPSEGDIPF